MPGLVILPAGENFMKCHLFAVLLALAMTCFAIGADGARYATVERAIDGDTVVLVGGERIRLLGVDTPELHHPSKPVQCYAEEARRFSRSMVENKQVKLTFEGPLKDRYGRTPAWVWYGDKYSRLLNADLIEEGYGFSYRKYPTSKVEEFNRMERKAREAGRGMWAPDACKNF